jgi:tetratricopeptide (TPR) repeat protein
MKRLFLLLLAAAIFSGCASMGGDISISGNRDQMEMNLARIEAAVVPLEAIGGAEARRRQNEITSARQLIASMEREAIADADYSGRLIAWSGRLSILEGRYSEAQRLYRQSHAASPGNIPSIILNVRLEGDPARRLEIIERELGIAGRQTSAVGFGELQIERGRSLFEMNRFAEATGAFDAAFSSGLADVYSNSYRADRNRAWELRNTSGIGAGTLEMLGRENISWNDTLTIVKNETQLLRFITGGRDIPNAELFSRLIDRAFIPFTQDITLNEWPQARPVINEIVTRAGAAWLIWHLHAEARADRGLLTRYSARFATGANPRSPIADIPVLSPFFDSILGCVETELLSLPDGRNFRPAQPIRGAELLATLRKIDN